MFTAKNQSFGHYPSAGPEHPVLVADIPYPV